MIKNTLIILILMVGQTLFIDQSKADMTDPLQSRINSGIVAKLFPQAESLGARYRRKYNYR